ncbi:hypothetical protein M409DRAFT_66373 [Zasmidium cellare ATCC 36951]|uniref:NodB homology domain-containing protein n=1 Tax=Zasmidium cellare ATCC 36951 TaxID=1080233 RepID=A0A6A6CHW6_ZASCE|nr:uncharacterized protein M409DRAFT_66373 [Zasmidium cellare ATCC 36951]KAF2166804.1 hypothetical protein M409DRAFT_66373 [Zasmidium cellare ATCC 36951]
MSFLAIEGYHAFVTGAQGGIGRTIVQELRANGCKVTAHDLKPAPTSEDADTFNVSGDISNEESISKAMQSAVERFGPINILVANAGITNEASHPNIWELPLETWEKVYRVNVRGCFLTIKHFIRAAIRAQEQNGGKELENLSIIVTGSECGKFGQAGHSEYASGKAGLQYGLVPTVKNEIVRINSKARINAVAPGWVNTELIGERLDDPRELYFEGQGTVALRKIARPEDVATAVCFLASHRASGHTSGQVISVDGGMEGRVVWREEELPDSRPFYIYHHHISIMSQTSPRAKINIALGIDFDAISGWLGTGAHPNNTTSDYSAGYFSAHVGVPRLLALFDRLQISDKVTWCIPGHSIETFPSQTRAIVASGAEIALHGYAHESARQMTGQQERDVLEKCISLVEGLTGKRPRGYRAPLYQLSERTISLLQEYDFLWDSSLSHYDSVPYFLPKDPMPIKPIDFRPDAKAEEWMHPSPNFNDLPKSGLIEIPCNWYAEDMTPLQFFPNTPNSAGYVDVRVVERMWMDRFEWLRKEMVMGTRKDEVIVYSLVIHPDTSGMAHVIGMLERFLEWLRAFGEEVEFKRYEDIAEEWRATRGGEK